MYADLVRFIRIILFECEHGPHDYLFADDIQVQKSTQKWRSDLKFGEIRLYMGIWIDGFRASAYHPPETFLHTRISLEQVIQ